ncbi:MAG: maleylpyruvate isomerase family mycothiol-dependent enzyme [Actinomycetota bacterium]
MRELGSVYEEVRGRIVELVAPLDEATAARPVPACPTWSVQDVIAHSTGNCADILNGNFEGAATEPWTQAQVEARREWKLGDVLAEWDDVGPKIAAMLDDFPGRYANQIIADLTVHEHDVRGALTEPGHRDSDGVAIGSEFLVTMMIHMGAVVSGVGPLEIRAGDKAWIVGTGEPATGDGNSWRDFVAVGETASPPEKAIVGSVSTSQFELFRATTGRRSAAQVQGFDWTVDPDSFLPIFGYGPFTIRATDLEE